MDTLCIRRLPLRRRIQSGKICFSSCRKPNPSMRRYGATPARVLTPDSLRRASEPASWRGLRKDSAPDSCFLLLRPPSSRIAINTLISQKQPSSHRKSGHAAVIRAAAAHPGGLIGADIAKAERWHGRGSGNELRAAVLGANDGLMSNLCRVMGMAGAGAQSHTTTQARIFIPRLFLSSYIPDITDEALALHRAQHAAPLHHFHPKHS